MSLAPYNAKIQDYLGDKKIGQSLWGIYVGIELEYEISKKTDYAASVPDISQEIPGEYENSPYVHHICDVLTKNHVSKLDSFIKRDGSLSDGIEVVTLPIVLSEIAGSDGKGAAKWKDFFDSFDKYGVIVRSTCGMHVHVSREQLTTLQIGKILKFLYDENNFNFIKMIAGRTPPTKYANIVGNKKVSDVSKHVNRYDGLNLTGAHTIEFRIFKSTTNLNRVIANIEFCESLVSFSWPSTVGLTENKLEHYLSFVLKNRKRYPNLFGLLVSKKYFSKPKKAKVTATKPNLKKVAAIY